LDLVEREGLDVRVLMLPQGQDPDDVIRRHGKTAFLSLREKALTLTEFKLELLREQSDMKSEDGRMHFAKEAAALIRNAGPVERERYVKTIARLSGFSPEALTQEVDAGKDRQGRTEPIREQPVQGDDVAQRILYLMATDPRVRARAFLRLDAADFATDLHRTMFEAMAELHQDDCSAALLSRFTDAKQASGVAAVLGMRHSATDKMVEDYINGLVLQRLGREIEVLNRQSKLTGADARGIAAEIQKRMMEMESIRKQRVGGAVIAPSHGGEAE
jgi:DNA primase